MKKYIKYLVWGLLVSLFSFNIDIIFAAEVCVTYDANGGPSAPAKTCVEKGGKVTIAAGPVWAGHRFTGWGQNKDTSYSSSKYRPGAETTINDSVTVYAIWAGSSAAKTTKTTTSACDSFIITQVKPFGGATNGKYFPGIQSTSRDKPLFYTKYDATDDASSSNEACKDGTKYKSYCIDPGVPGPKTDGIKYSRAEDLDINSKNASWASFSKAIFYIYKNAYPTANTPGFSNEDAYVIANTAVRLVTYSFGIGKTTSAQQHAVYAATKSKIDSDGGVSYKNYIDSGTVGEPMYGTNNTAKAILKASADLYFKAMEESKKAVTAVDALDFNYGPMAYDDIEFIPDATSDKVTFKTTLKGSLTGLKTFADDESSYIKNLKVTCESGITCTVENNPTGNILDIAPDSDTYEFKILIEGNVGSLTKAKIDVKIDVDYFDKNDTSNAFMTKSTDTSLNLQRMILFVDDESIEDSGTKLGSENEVDICHSIDINQYTEEDDLYVYYYTYCDPDSNELCFDIDALKWAANYTAADNLNFDEDAFKTQCCDANYQQFKDTEPEAYDKYYELCNEPVNEDCLSAIVPTYCSDSISDEYYADVAINEGIDISTGEMNYEKCVIDKNDLGGNTFNMKGFDAGTNPYCTVSCKEDWGFKLPNRELSVAKGNAIKTDTYFALKAEIDATRTCVTSTEINRTRFDNNVRDLNIEAIAAYNDYLYWDAASKAAANSNIVQTTAPAVEVWAFNDYTTQTTSKNTTYDCPTGYTLFNTNQCREGVHGTVIAATPEYNCPPGYDEQGSGASMTCSKKVCSTPGYTLNASKSYCEMKTGTVSCPRYKLTWSADQYKYVAASNSVSQIADINSTATDSNSTIIPQTDTISYDGNRGTGRATAVSCTYPSTPPASAWADFTATATANADDANQEYSDVISVIATQFDLYNACSAWDNEFDYDPRIEFTYPEDYYMEMIGEDNYFAPIGNLATTETKHYCNGASTGDLFECQGTEQATSFGTEPKAFVKCQGGACNMNNSGDVSLNKSVKIEVNKKGAYKPFTRFYTVHPSGDVIIEGDDQSNATLISKFTNIPTDQENGQVLPIRFNTAEGIYEYQLAIMQVGQYNDQEIDEIDHTNLGRIFGENQGGTKSVYGAIVEDSDGIYVFACTYEVIGEVCICCGDDESIEHRKDNDPSAYEIIANDGQIAFNYRPVSLYNMFPDASSATGTNWGTAKGQATIAKIQNEYTNNTEQKYIIPEYSYVIDPAGTAALREYNKNQAETENGFGYADFGLNCTDYGRKCTSVYLDKIQNGDVEGVQQLKRETTFTYYDDFTSWF